MPIPVFGEKYFEKIFPAFMNALRHLSAQIDDGVFRFGNRRRFKSHRFCRFDVRCVVTRHIIDLFEIFDTMTHSEAPPAAELCELFVCVFRIQIFPYFRTERRFDIVEIDPRYRKGSLLLNCDIHTVSSFYAQRQFDS